EYLLKSGEVCRHLVFIKKGILRSFTIDSRGHENIWQLAWEDNWIADLYSFIGQTPAQLYIEAIEPTELLLLSQSNLDSLYQEAPLMERFFRKLYEKAYLVAQQRIDAALHNSAEDRYRNLLEKQPNILKRVPLIYIASYLGITPESLSRIRRQV
ncbi:MAG: Crp/Fnr family transcriptional regulator, partial [Bacteroidota bacterium]